ncbi:BgTH12-04776 [Blumeria graminis f. sp. triticale]|uniref:Bgt-20366 n=3 Tax=Blumeria graminis TaxID=34373 RepID=A0A381LE77_BLUGR|nr:BgTH12-04776 [Blumeria graminis f. sp. triticale]VCU39240.1 Bgt-20366 [Blumeria graminis f. sp. tritici]
MSKFILNPQKASSTQTIHSSETILKGSHLVKTDGVAATPHTFRPLLRQT